jgi:LacI family transcriptional regulator
VVVKGIGNELFAEMLEIIQNLIAQTKYQLSVNYMDEDQNEVLEALRLCREVKPRGILFLGGNREAFSQDFEKIDVPCVLVTNDASGFGFDNLSSVSTHSSDAARCAAEILIEMGHRRIAIIGGDLRASDTSRQRYEGCLQAFREHGIAFDEEKDYQGTRFSFRDGYRATQKLLEEGRGFTAIFAAADVMAIGAIRALWEKGLRVPEDVSVMGFDGLPMCSYLVPQLTTVRQPVRAMAVRSVEILLQTMERGSPAVHEIIPVEIYRRESVRAIKE